MCNDENGEECDVKKRKTGETKRAASDNLELGPGVKVTDGLLPSKHCTGCTVLRNIFIKHCTVLL